MREKYPPMKSSMTSDKPIHEEFNVDDCIEKNIILLKRDNSLEKTNIISCKECYENR